MSIKNGNAAVAAATEALRQAVGGHSHCALLDFPDYGNVGDSAIWLGQIEALRLLGVSVDYVATTLSLAPAVLRQQMKSGVILINGGGNFGTLWPDLQAHRERVLAEFKDYRVVQLPQSLHYGDEAALEQTRALIQAHPDFTLMVRDQPSLQLATERLGAKTILCTDSALFLAGSLKRSKPVVDIFALARDDKEKVTVGLDVALQKCGRTYEIGDWTNDPMNLSRKVAGAIWPRAFGRLTRLPGFFSLLQWIWNSVARTRLHRGSDILCRGRVVVTDRLHAHIMCVLLGIPHVVLDNSYGKVQSFIAAWTHGSSLVHRASSVDAAVALAVGLLGGMPDEAPAGFVADFEPTRT